MSTPPPRSWMDYASQLYQDPSLITRNEQTLGAIRSAASRLHGSTSAVTGAVSNFGRGTVQGAINLILNRVQDPITREALRGQILRATGLSATGLASSGGRHTKHHKSKHGHKKRRTTRRR